MQQVETYWADGEKTLVAELSKGSIRFFHDNESVAEIDSDGNLCIKGKLFELQDPKGLSLLHANDRKWHLWPNPVVSYEGKQMTAFLVQDLNSPSLQYPAFFWNDTDFYVWGKLDVNVPGPVEHLLTLSPFELEGFGLYTKTGIRGTVKSQLDKVQDEPQTS